MRSAVAVLGLALLLEAGCGPVRQAPSPEEAAILDPGSVLARHNAWADSIQTLWARAALMLNFPTGEAGGKRMQHDLDGHVFLSGRDRLFVHGTVVGQEVFQVGMNPERFWLWIRPEVNTVWTGKRGGKGERDFVLSPADLLTALGLRRIDLAPEDSADLVAQRRHYVFTQQRRAGSRLVPVRRTWFDRATLRPVRVDVFNDSGSRLLMAELLRYERAGQADVCTVYRARFFGDEEVDLVLRLTGVRLDKEIKPRVFEYRLPPGAKERDLDVRADDLQGPDPAAPAPPGPPGP